ncbi:MAG: stage sporulation protein [Actinomycetota bacterium]
MIQVDGRGFGHGVGMAQDGALAMGAVGATTQEILEQFYPGTTTARSSGSVRVPVFTGNSVTLGFPDGGEVRGPPTFPVKIPVGGSAVVTREGDNIRVTVARTTSPNSSTTTSATSTTTTMSSTTTTPVTLFPPNSRDKQTAQLTTTTSAARPATTTTTSTPVPAFSGSAIAVANGDGRISVTPRDRRYRGVIEMTPVAGGVRFVNQVNVETYLRGLGEVRNPNWPPSALRAQATAARTYALRAMAAAGELCDTQRCQVYIGADAEYAAMDKAVAATSGQVLMYGKALVSAVYSANGGGYSANREEGFGLSNSSYPYLRAAPYLCDDPAPWTATIALRDVASRLRYRGTLTAVEVTQRGPSGRAIVVHLTGSDGDKTVGGLAFGRALGLRSTMFNLRVTTAIKVPALTGGSTLQAPPEDAAAITETVSAVIDTPAKEVQVVAAGRSLPKPAAETPSRAAVAAAALMLAVSLALFVRWRRQRQVADLLSTFVD